MKRIVSAVLIALFLTALLLAGTVWTFSLLFAPKDAILESLPDYESKEFYTSGGFQDYTDYGKYTYRIYETELLENPYFFRVTEEDIPEILAYIDNFEGWVEACHDFPKEKYDFDAASVEVGDYFCLLSEYEEADKAFWNYDLYYFDLEAGILYYFHNNI